MKRILIMGGICKKLVHHKCLNDYKIVRRIYHSSPISLGESFNEKHSVYKSVSLDISKDFELFLEQNPTEYLVMDLSKLCTRLFKKDGTYYTEPTKELMDSEFYENWKETEIVPYHCKPEEFLIQFDNFISIILQHYSGKKIVLLHTHHPKWFVVKGYVRKQTSEISQGWIDFFEKRFIDKTGCKFIDVTKYYFSLKGQKKLQPFVYEEYAYKNIRNELKILINQKDNSGLCDYYSYERYMSFYKNLDKKFYNVFLDVNNPIDEIVMCSHPDFVSKYIDILVVLKQQNFKDINEAITFFEENNIETKFYRVLCAYNAIKSKQYYLTHIDYAVLFEMKMSIPELLEEVRVLVTTIDDKLHNKQINYYNYGYWFFRMQERFSDDNELKKKAIINLERYIDNQNINIRPTLVDIWGSCISRVPVNFNDAQIVVDKYLYQVTPIGINNDPVPYDPNVFTVGKRNQWRDKLARIELERTMKTILDSSASEWIIVDFFTLTAANIHLYCGQYFNLHLRQGEEIGGVVTNFYNNSELVVYVSEQIKEFGDYLRQRYGENIIVVKSRRSLHYENQYNEIVSYGNISINRIKNEFSNKCNDELVKYLNCYYIDLVEQFLGSETTLFELSPTYFENELYIEEGRIIQNILEGKEKQKHITTYSNNTRLMRMSKFLKNNKGNLILNELFKDKVMDPYVLQMDSNTVDKWYDLLVQLYNKEFSTFEEAYEYIKADSIYSEILNFIDNLK